MARQPACIDGGVVLLAGSHLDLPIEARCHLEERYQLVKAGNGAAAVAWLQTHVPDLVIADLPATGIDGHWLCRAIVQNQALISVSILMISADSPEAWLAALQEGADDCVGKPIDVRRFGARVKNLVARSRRIREFLAASSGDSRRPESGSAHDANGSGFVPGPGVFLKRVEEAIDAKLDDVHFSVSALARAMAMGRASLYRQLGMLGNMSPGRLILERRLQHAASLFTNYPTTVTDVAYAVGFKSLSHFSRSFRKYHGVTPMAYLKRAARRNLLLRHDAD